MILGFTGTRKGMSSAQREALPGLIAALPSRIIHGGAEGADEEFDAFLAPLFAEAQWTSRSDLRPITVFPCTSIRDRFWRTEASHRDLRDIAGIMPPLDRNREIVIRSSRILACPRGMHEELRSGTWATIRYAWSKHKPVTLLFPDGSVEERTDRKRIIDG